MEAFRLSPGADFETYAIAAVACALGGFFTLIDCKRHDGRQTAAHRADVNGNGRSSEAAFGGACSCRRVPLRWNMR
jgi:hypothetical protein